jgi:hypothetical protein
MRVINDLNIIDISIIICFFKMSITVVCSRYCMDTSAGTAEVDAPMASLHSV